MFDFDTDIAVAGANNQISSDVPLRTCVYLIKAPEAGLRWRRDADAVISRSADLCATATG